MHLIITLYILFLFFLITPGVVITLPLKNKYQAAAIHALLFTFIWQLTHKFVWNFGLQQESFINGSKLSLLRTTLNDSSFDNDKKIKMIKDLDINDETFSKIIDNKDLSDKLKVEKLIALDDFTVKKQE